MAASNSVLEVVPSTFLLLVTEREDGSRIPTPMCFAAVNETIYLRTSSAAAKLARIRREPFVQVAACTFRGRRRSSYIECMASVVPSAREPDAERALRGRYGLARRVFDRSGPRGNAYIELLTMTERNRIPEDSQGAQRFREEQRALARRGSLDTWPSIERPVSERDGAT